MNLTKTINKILVGLTLFLSITAILGGIALMINFYTPPVDFLKGSIFKSFFIPGFALSAIVGGSSAFAAILLLRKDKFANWVSTAAGIIIMFFEFVEVMIIGSPEGPARFMQVFYFGLGTLIVSASMGTWFLELFSDSRNPV